MSIWPYPWHRSTNPFSIPPGALRDAISIQAKSTAAFTPTGSPLATWSTVWSGRALIEVKGQKEAYQPGEFAGQVTYRVSINNPGTSVSITAGMQVLFGTRTFTVQAVNPEPVRKRILFLVCIEIDGVE